MSYSKIIGSIFIIVGTCIGAGILALPIVGASSGFIMSSLLMISIWILMTITAILVLEINLVCPDNSNSFGTMAYRTLGKPAQVVTWIIFLLLLYSLLSAYTAGATNLLKSMLYSINNTYFPTWLCSIIFTCLLGGMVYWSTNAVDYTNRFLLTGKGFLLISSIILLFTNIDFSNIYYDQAIHSKKYLAIAAPIFLCSFGFHVVIPSIRNYIGYKPKELRFIVICGTSICLAIYLLWLLAVLGTVPANKIEAGSSSINELIRAIALVTHSKIATTSVSVFSSISMTTSFLGVALAIFDFLADGFKRANTRYGRLQTALITFIPPLMFVLYYPKGFMMALGYASIFVAILLVILPALMAYKLRQGRGLLIANKILLNKYLLVGIIIIGTMLIVLQILAIVK